MRDDAEMSCLGSTFKTSWMIKDQSRCKERKVVWGSMHLSNSETTLYSQSKYSRPRSFSNDGNLQVPYKPLMVRVNEYKPEMWETPTLADISHELSH